MKKVNGKSLAQLALIGLMAGGVSLTGCKKSTSSDGDGTAEALSKFKTSCEAGGGTYKEIASCTGTGSCKGTSYDTATGKETAHDCAGMNTCAGAQCLES